MLATLGALFMMAGMYSFFALRNTVDLAAALVVMGILLVLGQLLKAAKNAVFSEAAKGVPRDT